MIADPGPEPTRARYPDSEGYAERHDGVRIFYEVYGEGEPTLVFSYPWPICHSRTWKAQIPYFARHYRVVVIDPRGAGKSDVPSAPGAYRHSEQVADVLAVLDATGTERAVLVTVSMGARIALRLAADHPERVTGAAVVGPFLALTPWPAERSRRRTFAEPRASRRVLYGLGTVVRSLPKLVTSPTYRRASRQLRLPEALEKFCAVHLLNDQRSFFEFFLSRIATPDPHSSRVLEEAVGYAIEVDPRILLQAFNELDMDGDAAMIDADEIRAACARSNCPWLVVQGDHDLIAPPEWGAALARETGGRLVRVERGSHDVRARKPVTFNLALRDFADSLDAG